MSLPLIVGISGATGIVYAIEALKTLREIGVPTHLVISEAGVRTLAIETDVTLDELRALADVVHNIKDIGAAISSGSFRTRGMLIAPCSVKTLSGIAHSYNQNLLIRAADVTLKERRPLVLMVRETPLHKGHLDLMARASDLGALILPPMPAFYHRPTSIADIVRHGVARALDHFGLEHPTAERWQGA